MAGSNGYNFTAGTKARANEVNSNFEWFRGHYLPVTQSSTWANTSGVYDLGSSSVRWRAVYLADTSTAFNGASNAITNDNLNENAGKRIYSSRLTAATSTFNITGLNGDTANIYRLLIHGLLDGAGHVSLGFNNNSTNSYYGQGATATVHITLNNDISSITTFIDALLMVSGSGLQRGVIGRASDYTRNSQTITAYDIQGVFSSTSVTITSIQISRNTTTANFGIGTLIELYSLG